MADVISKSIYVLSYTSSIGWILLGLGFGGLIKHDMVIDQGFFKLSLIVGIILIMGSKFLRWIFNL